MSQGNYGIDLYSGKLAQSVDVIIRRIGWRLTDKKLNPLGFKARTDLGLKTWGQVHSQPDEELRAMTELSAGGITDQTRFNKHFDFFLHAMEFYEESCEQPTHEFDQLVPVLRDGDWQLNFSDSDLEGDSHAFYGSFEKVIMQDTPIAHQWRLAPKFVSTQQCNMGNHLRSFGFIPSLEFLTANRYAGHGLP